MFFSTYAGRGALQDISKPTILVVDDLKTVILVTLALLQAKGFETLEASSGDDAADLLQSGTRIDLLLTDWQMPGELDGVGLAKFAREIHPELPIILRTSDENAVAPLVEPPFMFASKSQGSRIC